MKNDIINESNCPEFVRSDLKLHGVLKNRTVDKLRTYHNDDLEKIKKFMTQNKHIEPGRIVETKFTFHENGVIVKTDREEDGYCRDIYTFPDGSDHTGAWYKDEYDTSGTLFKKSFLLSDGSHRDLYFKDGELKKVISYFGDGKKSATYINKTKNRVIAWFDENGLMDKRTVWDADGMLISNQDFHKNGVIKNNAFYDSKNLLSHTEVYDENGKILFTEFPPNEKGEIKRYVYCDGELHAEVCNPYGKLLFEEHFLDNSKYHSMRVYHDGDKVKRKAYLDENGVVKEQSFYCDGVIRRTEFFDAEGVVIRTVNYDALGDIKTARRLDNEDLKYMNAEPVAIPGETLREENLLPCKEGDLSAINSR